MSLTLECKSGSYTNPHPVGVHNAVCVDVIDLGLEESDYLGVKRMVPKVRLMFETEMHAEDGQRWALAKTFTASLHPKARLAKFLGCWRGRPILPGEVLDLNKVLGVSCTLVISHRTNAQGNIYAAIEAVSKPTKSLAPSGDYDPDESRKRLAERRAGARSTGRPADAGGQETRRAEGAARQPVAEREVAVPF